MTGTSKAGRPAWILTFTQTLEKYRWKNEGKKENVSGWLNPSARFCSEGIASLTSPSFRPLPSLILILKCFATESVRGRNFVAVKKGSLLNFLPCLFPEIAGLFCFSNFCLPSIFGVILSFFSVSKSSKNGLNWYVYHYVLQTKDGRKDGTFCFTSTEARLLIGDGDRGGRRLNHGYRPKKTGETMDRRQNTGSVKAMSPLHCTATSALRRNCCFKWKDLYW